MDYGRQIKTNMFQINFFVKIWTDKLSTFYLTVTENIIPSLNSSEQL